MNRFFLFLVAVLVGCTQEIPVEEGVSKSLAEQRFQQVQDIIYSLQLEIPLQKSDPIIGEIKIRFDYSGNEDLLLDFKVDESNLRSVSFENEIEAVFEKGHIVLPGSELKNGKNEVTIEFVAGDMSLNRNDEFLYTLFVPDRASTAFPLFDQPDLKAIYNLTLNLPKDWVAIANGELLAVDSLGERSVWYFGETEPVSTYLFSFAAGKFEVLTETRGDMEMTMLHRETDSAKVSRNVKDIFDLHFKALDWLEEYTGIPYPFSKFGFVLIPSFQYGGMEHPGAIVYNSSGLFLEESYTQGQLLGRASVIAHETAHMWFGDLVTMKWFNDVWMKEVFANFMAAKIINPTYPEINHDLRFLMAHYPSAYSIDRTSGANPIQQPLDNLKNAGQMYGAIIYQKAPIVMRHLEAFVGEDIFQKSLQEYLSSYAYDNATWDDLVEIIDGNSDLDVLSWSQSWVKEPGMPTLEINFSSSDNTVHVSQNDNLSLRPQPVSFLLKNGEQELSQKIFLQTKEDQMVLDSNSGLANIIPNPDGFSYGYFKLDERTVNYLLDSLSEFDDPVIRGSCMIMLNEAMLNFELDPLDLLNACLRFLPEENEIQNAQYLLGVINNIHWRYLTPEIQGTIGTEIEKLLLGELDRRESSREKAMVYNSFIHLATSEESVGLMRTWWNKSATVEGLTFSENDFIRLAYELAIRSVSGADSILNTQLDLVKNPDRKQRMEFVMPALSSDKQARNNFFESLKTEVNREHERWVLEGLRYLHHPLRAEESVEYVLPSLELLEEIQLTGDIFFPTRWLATTFSGHTSEEVTKIVSDFLDSHPDYHTKLREKILQTSDQLFRSTQWKQKNTQSNF